MLAHFKRSHPLASFALSAGGAALLTLTAAAPTWAQSAPAVYAFMSAPNTQAVPTSIPSPTVETFDGTGMTTGIKTPTAGSPYSSAIGSYTGTFDVISSAVTSDAQYGAGTGNYFSFGAQSGTSTPVTLTFGTPVTYFGLSYNAGDANNGMTFFDDSGNNLGRYSTSNLIAKLNKGSGSVTALNGTSYPTTNYFGRPDGNSPSKTVSNQDTAEPFAFLNFFPSSGTKIGKVVFDNSGNAGTGFESDNHTISTSAANTPPTTGSYVVVGSTAATDASSLALLLGTLPLGAIAVRRRRLR